MEGIKTVRTGILRPRQQVLAREVARLLVGRLQENVLVQYIDLTAERLMDAKVFAKLADRIRVLVIITQHVPAEELVERLYNEIHGIKPVPNPRKQWFTTVQTREEADQ